MLGEMAFILWYFTRNKSEGMKLSKRKKQIVIDCLKDKIKGDILDDNKVLLNYAHDKSIYEIIPMAVIFPENHDELCRTVQILREFNLSITARGGGSGTAGACLSNSFIIAFKRNGPFSHIGRFVEEKATVSTSAGVIHRKLQDFLKEYNYYLPADLSSSTLCMVGGNIATKASGPHALKHGSIDTYLQHCTFVDYRGKVINTKDKQTIPHSLITKIMQLEKRINSNPELYQRLKRREKRKISSGYNLFPLLDKSITIGTKISRLLAGSVGTLGIITNAEFTVEPYIKERATVHLFFSSLELAGEAVQLILELDVAAIEIISAQTIKHLKEKQIGTLFAYPDNSHLLMVDLEGPCIGETISKIKKITKSGRLSISTPIKVLVKKDEQNLSWNFRKMILPHILRYKPDLHALSVVNDVGVEPVNLSQFIPRIETIFKKFGLTAVIYGHAGSGNLHLRPFFKVTDPNLKAIIQKVADEIYSTVLDFDGTITAEHGMGPVRAPYLKQEWGDEFYSIMKEIKSIFDPDNVFGSKAMFSEAPITENMKPFTRKD